MNKSNIFSIALGLSLIGCGTATDFLGKNDNKKAADVNVQHSEKNAALNAYLKDKKLPFEDGGSSSNVCVDDKPGQTDPDEIAPAPAPDAALTDEEYQDLNNIDYGKPDPKVDECNDNIGYQSISVLVCSAGGIFTVVDSDGKVTEIKKEESCVRNICYQISRPIGEPIPAIFQEGQEDKFISEPKATLEETELVWICEEEGTYQTLPEETAPGSSEESLYPQDAE